MQATRPFLLLLSAAVLLLSSQIGLSDTSSEYGGSLRSVIVITRHGDRTPVKTFPNTKSTWPEGMGQLTGLGMKQLYLLGQRFRQKYIEEHRFLQPTYGTKEVHARSTSRERTLMSAQSFMLGLFPPGVGPKDSLPNDLQVVPIHAAPPAEDTLLYAYKNCPKLSDLTKKVRSSPEWKAMEAKTEGLRAKLSTIFGFPVRLKDLHSLNTIIRCEEIHQRDVLPGLNDPELRKELSEVNDWLFRVKFPTTEMGRLAGGNLLHEISVVFSSHTPQATHKQMAKLTHFSAHDGTILALMAAMGAKNFSLPYYADFLTFELHEIGAAHYVKIFYNDQPFSIPDCDHHCSFNQFTNLAKSMRHENWFDACGIDRCTRKESEKTEKALEEEGNIQFKEERQHVAEDLLKEKQYNQTLRRFEWELVGVGVVVGVVASQAFSYVMRWSSGSATSTNSNTNDKKKKNNKQHKEKTK